MVRRAIEGALLPRSRSLIRCLCLCFASPGRDSFFCRRRAHWSGFFRAFFSRSRCHRRRRCRNRRVHPRRQPGPVSWVLSPCGGVPVRKVQSKVASGIAVVEVVQWGQGRVHVSSATGAGRLFHKSLDGAAADVGSLALLEKGACGLFRCGPSQCAGSDNEPPACGHVHNLCGDVKETCSFFNITTFPYAHAKLRDIAFLRNMDATN